MSIATADMEGWPSRLTLYWRQQSLVSQFTIAGGVVFLIAMLFCGFLISSFVRSNVLNQRAAATALFIDSVVSPELQELDTQTVLGPVNRANLDFLMSEEEFGRRIPFLEVWLADGTVAYSNSDEIIGRKFDLPQAAEQAFKGDIVAAFADLTAQEHVVRRFVSTYSEIYSPVRKYGSAEILAVVEVHESVDRVAAALTDVTIRSWLTVGLTGLAVAASLYFIVKGGSETILFQKRALSARLWEAQELANQHQELKAQAQRASRTVTEMSDHLMRNVGADLHDGPAQLISFATLKVEMARRAKDPETRQNELVAIETNLISALDNIRDIARGLALPAIEDLDLDAVIDQAIDQHIRRTGMRPVLHKSNLGAPHMPGTVNACIYRFIQEGLNNAYWHADPASAEVEAGLAQGILTICVTSRANRGRTAAPQPELHDDRGIRYGLGLKGLNARVLSLGGDFAFSLDERRARLSMTINLEEFASDG